MRALWTAIVVAILAGAGVAMVGLRERQAAGESTVAARDDTTLVDTTTSAHAAGAGDTAHADSIAADTAPVHLPHPEVMLGTWHHGDSRSQYGDSLVLVLDGNGSARATERHWTLDAQGWHDSRVRRTGTWTLRYRGTERMDLCTEWVTPREFGSCERILLAQDSTLSDTIVMQYAGRHWRKVTRPPGDGAARRPRSRGKGGTASGS